MEAFKNTLVGKSCNLKKKIEKLPEELRKLWINREFISFLDKFKDIISIVPNDKRQRKAISTDIQEKITPVLPFLPELGYSFDNEVHKRMHARYKHLLKLCDGPKHSSGELRREVASSSNKYLVNILCPKRKKFCTDDFFKQHLTFISGRWEEQTLKVEKQFKSQKQSDLSVSRFYGHKYNLQQIALDFLDQSYIYPLNYTTFPPLPGVYFIYHVGETQLYEGSQISPSTDYPVYVGMSRKSIADRLRDHRGKIEKASKTEQLTKTQQTELVKLKMTDFVVRFMIVDIQHYAPSIEGMLIEYFSPVWNSQTTPFAFGSGDRRGNLWHEVHINKDPKTIENVLRALKI